MRLLILLLMLLLVACPPIRNTGDDDDSTGDDDDATGDDDDATGDDDDDATGDDDDDDDDITTPDGCPPQIEEALSMIGDWQINWSCGSASFASGLDDQTVRLAAWFQLGEISADSVGQTWALYGEDIDAKDEVPGTLELQSGYDLFAYDCNDAIYVEPEVEIDLQPVGGALTLTITEFNDEWWWTGDVSARGLVFEDPDGNLCEVPEHTWEGLGFGWLPG